MAWTGGGRLGYQPALDGLRGVAVLAVLAFHADLAGASGGYLGVSIFFTLSGFLITRVLLEERADTGTVHVGRFWARRVRRLAPAGLLTLAGILVAVRLGAFAGVHDLRRDVVGAAVQLANWAQLTSGREYADLFDTSASPVDHWWSLAIEEQFYLLWPLAFALLARRSRRALRVGVVGLFVAAAATAPLVAWRWGSQAAYLSTPARLAEILAGVGLAVLVDLDRLRGADAARWARLGLAAAAAVVAVAAVTPAEGGWAYHGGLPAFALLSAAVVGGALVDGPLRRGLAARPLVALGTISYGVYLYHWPIFLLVDEQVPDAPAALRLAAKLGLTLAAAAASHRVVERRIRHLPHHRATVPTGLVAIAAVVAAAAIVVPPPATGWGVVDTRRLAHVRLEPVRGDLPPLAAADGSQARPLRVVVVGDSTGEVVGAGLVDWVDRHPGTALIAPEALVGCGIVAGGELATMPGDRQDECRRLMDLDLPAALPDLRPDVVVVSVSLADTWTRSWDGGPVHRPTDLAFAERIRADYARWFGQVLDAGVPHVVWLWPPPVRLGHQEVERSYLDGGQDLIERTVADLVAEHPGRVSVLDTRAWFEASGLDTDRSARPDGAYLTPEAGARVAAEHWGPELLALALDG